MQIKSGFMLLAIVCCTQLHAQDAHTAENPFKRDHSFLPKPQPKEDYSQEELSVMRAIHMACKQIHEQTGTLLTPTELFNIMNAACESIGTWQLFCAEHGIEPMSHMELFEQLVAAQKQKTLAQKKNIYCLGIGAALSTIPTISCIYFTLPKDNRPAFELALKKFCAQMIHLSTSLINTQTNALTKNPIKNLFEKLSDKQRITINVVVDSTLSIAEEWLKSKDTAPIFKLATVLIRKKLHWEDGNNLNKLSELISKPKKYIARSVNPNDNLSQLIEPESNPSGAQLTFNGRNCAIYISKAAVNHAFIPIAHNILNRSSVLAKDSALKIGEFIIITKHQAITTTLETAKQLTNYELTRHLSDNKNKQDTDTTKLKALTPADAANLLAHNMAHEIATNAIIQAGLRYTPSLFPEKNKDPELIQMGVQIAIPVVAAVCATVAIKTLKATGNWLVQNIPSA